MNEQQLNENNRSVQRSNILLVCSLLSLYAVCILGSLGAIIRALQHEKQAYQVNITSTAFAVETQQANATATSIVRTTEQAQYEFIEHFDISSGRWLLGFVDTEYWKGKRTIKDDVYLWEVQEVKKTFISWASFYKGEQLKDFDVYVDTKILEAAPGDACSGLIFRKSPEGWDEGGYYFVLCNNSIVVISYHTESDGWERLATISYNNVRLEDWNRLEVLARGDQFTFLINGDQIYEMEDGRQEVGGLALVMELNEKVPVQVLFDNFGYQPR